MAGDQRSLGVNVALVRDERILLTRREDYDVWCLPGGAVEPGETVAKAAVREMWEETGYEVALETLVGIYYQSSGFHTCVFLASYVSGTLRPDPGEVIEVGQFGLDDLPDGIMWWYETRIRRALAGATGEIWFQDIGSAVAHLSRNEAYTLRDRAAGSRRAFYEKHLSRRGPRNEERHL